MFAMLFHRLLAVYSHIQGTFPLILFHNQSATINICANWMHLLLATFESTF